MGDAEYVAKQHICVGPAFVLFEPFSYVRATNLVLHKLPDPLVSFPFQQRDRFRTKNVGTPCSVLAPNQECGKVYELIFYF